MKAEEYEAQAAWTTLGTLQGLLEKDLRPDADDERYAVRRLHSVAEFVDALREVDPTLVEPAALSDVNTHLTQIVNHLNAYTSDMDANKAHLSAAATQVTSVMTSVRQQFPTWIPDEATRAAKAASTRYKNALDAEAERLVEMVDDLKAQLADAHTQRQDDQTAASERLDELQQQITSAETEIGTLTTKLSAQIDTQRTAFEAEATQRSAAFKEAEQLRETAEADRVERAVEAARKAREQQETDAASLLAKLETYKTQAASLVDTTSRHAIAGEYGTWSSHQARAAFWWTVVAVVIGVGTVGGLIFAVKSAADDSIQFTVYKTSISIIGLIVAGYAARQAAEHRREERTAKRLALDLAALGPFLEQVTDPGDLRSEIARRVFVPERAAGTDSEPHLKAGKGSLTISELAQLVAVLRPSP